MRVDKKRYAWANYESGEIIELREPTTLFKGLKIAQERGFTSENGFIMYNDLDELKRDAESRKAAL